MLMSMYTETVGALKAGNANLGKVEPSIGSDLLAAEVK